MGSNEFDQRRQTRDMVCLHVRLEHRDDRRTRALGRSEVALDQQLVRIDDRELALSQAAEQIRRAGRVLKQERTQDHAPKLGQPDESR